MIRVILDTNVVISATILQHGISAGILRSWRVPSFELVSCPSLLDEITEKLHLPRIRNKYRLTDEQIDGLLLEMRQSGIIVPGTAAVDPMPPDADDTMLFAAAIESDADYIVTGDKALLQFAWNGPGRVVSPRQFWEEILNPPK